MLGNTGAQRTRRRPDWAYEEGANAGGRMRKERPPEKKKRNLLYLNIKPEQMDYALLITVFFLVMVGLVMVFSSSYYTALTASQFSGDPLHFIKRQAGWAVFSFAAMMFMANFEYRSLKRYAFLLYAVSNILLVVVLIIGEERGGSKRWLDIGPMTVQPSEIAKIATILFLSVYIDRHRDGLKTLGGFMKCMAIVVLPVVLIAIENFSTALVVAVIGVAIMFFASPKIWYFIAMAVPAGLAAAAAVLLEPFRYRLTRIQTWLDPFADQTGDGFQTVQSLYAVASGGFFGLGLGQSRQKLGYIPEAFNDIIFSIVCEELGLVGAAGLILLFYFFIYKGISIALKCKDLFGTLMASGITCMVAVQVIINIAVNTNAIPVTGMPLPFISYGGSSLLIMMSCAGILLNISRYVRD